MNNIEKYFAGEKFQCLVGIILSVSFITLSIYLVLIQKTGFAKGMGYACLPLSVFLLAICLGIVLRTPKDIHRVKTFYTAEPQRMITEERPRMEKVMKTFVLIKRIEIFLFIAGGLLLILAWNNDLARGVAIGVMAQALILYLFDLLAEMRGQEYYKFLESL